MRRSPQQLPDFAEHRRSAGEEAAEKEEELPEFVVPGPTALRLSQEERDKAEANERRREARLWRERQQLLREEEAARGQRELQEKQRRQVQLEDEGRSKLFETVAAGISVGMPHMMGSSADSGEEDGDADLEERPAPSPEVVRRRIAGRRQLAEAREFAEMGPSMASAAIAQFEAGLDKLMPILRVGPAPDPTLREEVMQAVDAMERLRHLVRTKQPPMSSTGPSNSARGSGEAVRTAGRSGAVAADKTRHSEPQPGTAASTVSPTAYPGDWLSQPWVSSFKSGLLSPQNGVSPANACRDQLLSEESTSVRYPAQPVVEPDDAEAAFSESLDSLLGFVEDLHSADSSADSSPVRLMRPNGTAAPPPRSPIRLPASPRDSERMTTEERADRLRQSIVALYQRVNPNALPELPGVFNRYRGREQELWSTVCRKYGHEPTDRESLLASSYAAAATEQPRPGAGAARAGEPASAQEARRSMTLEHTDVAPPPSPELRSWVSLVPAPGEGTSAATTPKKINIRLSREAPTSQDAPASSRNIGSLYQDDCCVGGDESVHPAKEESLQEQGQDPHQSGESMVLGASMTRWMTREGAAAVVRNADLTTGSQLPEPAVIASSGEDKMSVAEAAAAAARAPAIPSSPIHSATSLAQEEQTSPYQQPCLRTLAEPLDIPVAAVVNSSNESPRVLPKRLDPASPHRPLPGRMAYTGPKGHGTKAAIAAAAKVDRQVAAARVVQRAWSRWSLRANEKAKKWKKELELLRWRITTLRNDGEDLAAEELEAKLQEVLASVDSVKLRELERRGDPKRRGGVSAFGPKRLDPWHQRVSSSTVPVSPADSVGRIVRTTGGAESRIAKYEGTDKDDNGDSIFSDDEQQLEYHGQRTRERDSTGDRSRSQTFSDDEKEDGWSREAFSDDEDDRLSEDNYYYNAHDSDIHEFASQLGSFFGGAARSEEQGVVHASSWYSERSEEENDGEEILEQLDLSPREQVLVTSKSEGMVGSEPLMLALQSLEAEIGVGNKSSFRRAVAVFQLHLGALVSGEAEQDGLNTIDQQDPTYETRVGKYPSAKLCLKALGFCKRSGGLWVHAGVRGAVDYGDGTVPRAVAGRMLRLLGVAAERGNAPNAALCRQLEQQTLMALRRGGVVPSSRIDTGKRSRRARTGSGRNDTDGSEDENCAMSIERGGMPPVGWRPPGFTPSTVVLKPATGMSGLLPSQRCHQQPRPESSLVPSATNASATCGAPMRTTGTVVSAEKLARLARPKDVSNPRVRMRRTSPSSSGANAVLQKTKKIRQSPDCTDSRNKARPGQIDADNVSTGTTDNGSGIDLTIGAKELTKGRKVNQKLFVLCSEPEPEPGPEPGPELKSEPEPRRGSEHQLGPGLAAASGSAHIASNEGSFIAAPAPTLTVDAPIEAPPAHNAAPPDLAALQRLELAMTSGMDVAAPMDLTQPRSVTQAASVGMFSDDDAWEQEDKEEYSGAALREVEGGCIVKPISLDAVEQVVQKAEAAVAEARRKGHQTHEQPEQPSAPARATTSSLHSIHLQPSDEDEAQQCKEEHECDNEDADAGLLDTGIPAAFRAGIQAKLSAQGASVSGRVEPGESVEARARREYADWLQQRISASLEPK